MARLAVGEGGRIDDTADQGCQQHQRTKAYVLLTLMLLELSLLPVPSTEAFLEQAGPAFEAYANGDHETALAIFLDLVGGVDWASCRAVLDERLPGAVAHAIKDADTFFGVELPAVTDWVFGRGGSRHPPAGAVAAGQAGNTQPVWVETAEFLRSRVCHRSRSARSIASGTFSTSSARSRSPEP